MKHTPSRTNIYPNLYNQSLWTRLKVAFRIVFFKQYFPAPYDWYEKLYPIVSNEYSTYASMAVEKVEREFDKGPQTHNVRRKEASQWMRHYAVAAGKSGDIPYWKAHFLIEWWVLRKKGII